MLKIGKTEEISVFPISIAQTLKRPKAVNQGGS